MLFCLSCREGGRKRMKIGLLLFEPFNMNKQQTATPQLARNPPGPAQLTLAPISTQLPVRDTSRSGLVTLTPKPCTQMEKSQIRA